MISGSRQASGLTDWLAIGGFIAIIITIISGLVRIPKVVVHRIRTRCRAAMSNGIGVPRKQAQRSARRSEPG